GYGHGQATEVAVLVHLMIANPVPYAKYARLMSTNITTNIPRAGRLGKIRARRANFSATVRPVSSRYSSTPAGIITNVTITVSQMNGNWYGSPVKAEPNGMTCE